MIVGEDPPDEGDVVLPKRVTLGYFKQDVGEMSGKAVIDETISGSGRAGALHHEIQQLEADMSDPDKADQMEKILERYGEIQGEYQDCGGYELEERVREGPLEGALPFRRKHLCSAALYLLSREATTEAAQSKDIDFFC